MIREVKFLRAARAEAVDAAHWYAEKAAGLDLRFTDAVNACTARIAEVPGLFPEIIAGVRKAKVKEFPYTVFFEVDAETALVIAVFHQKRDPRVWKARIRP